MMSGWRANGVPQFLAPEDADDQTARDLLASELKDLAAHGVRDGAGEMVGYFGFARTGLRVSAQSVRILEVIVPHLYATYCRILGEEALHAGAIPRADSAVTQRETEILNWIKEGKTTTDIAGILRLSPFTVKNHVQNILKKLGARSRSHAVAQAMALGILQN
jgi:transcriptional regulator EpsA